MTPKILIFSITIGADYSFYVKSIATFALTFFGYIVSVLASVYGVQAIVYCTLIKFYINIMM